MHEHWTQVESRVDYITATALIDKLPESVDMADVQRLAAALLREQEHAGNDLRYWSMEGFTGLKAGSVCVGQSNRGMLFRLSGDAAADRWREVYDASSNVSRLDVAATIRCEGAWIDLTRIHHEQALTYKRKSAPKLRVTRIDGGTHGNSLNIGSRSSDAYGRIYDKGAESGQERYQDCWRYEVEFKRSLAKQAADILSDDEGGNTEPAAMGFAWFERRAVRSPRLLSVGALPCSSRKPSDDEGRLRWLRRDVARCVATLIEHGRREDVMTALRLPIRVQSS